MPYLAYTSHGSDYPTLKQANVTILTNALQAVDKVCPNLRFWTLQTGGKAYGVEFLDKGIPYNPPLKESSPRIPESWASNIFYYAQYDTIKAFNKGKSWKFCEIRPDAIIGFVPHNNAMNLAQALGLFLSLYVSIEGSGAEVSFPGSEEAYKALHTDTSQDILARFHIYASLHQDAVSTRAFNIADGNEPISWKKIWPEICAYFSLKGVGPDSSKTSGAKWVLDRRDKWREWEDEKGLRKGMLEATSWEFLGALTGGITFDRQYDLGASREVGFHETVETVKGYTKAFDRMRVAKIIA